MNKLTASMARHAAAVTREVNAKALMLDADALASAEDLAELMGELDVPLVVVTRNRDAANLPESKKVSVIQLPRVPLLRLAQIKMAVLIGLAERMFTRGDLLICLSGAQHSERLDMLAAVKVGDEPEMMLTESNPLPEDVQPAVFERVLNIASELAMEGREGRPVGALFVIGDSDNVLSNSRQLILNPFHGYPEEDRNLLTGAVDETIKEYSALDGAFIIRGDGVLLAAGRYLVPKGKPVEPLRPGLGARHESAAAITSITNSLAIVLSQSTSTLTVFDSGRVLTEIEKLRAGTQDRFFRSKNWPDQSD